MIHDIFFDNTQHRPLCTGPSSNAAACGLVAPARSSRGDNAALCHDTTRSGYRGGRQLRYTSIRSLRRGVGL